MYFLPADYLAQYANAMAGVTSLSGSAEPNFDFLAKRFWLVVRVKKENFGEKLEMSPGDDLILPKDGCGEFIGVARNEDELNNLITPDPTNPDDLRANFVYLTYKVKIPGNSVFRRLLQFLGEHEMLDEDKEPGGGGPM